MELTSHYVENEEVKLSGVEIYEVIKSLKKNEAAGEDKIYGELLKLRGFGLANEIFKLVSLIWHKNKYQSLCKLICIFMWKPQYIRTIIYRDE